MFSRICWIAPFGVIAAWLCLLCLGMPRSAIAATPVSIVLKATPDLDSIDLSWTNVGGTVVIYRQEPSPILTSHTQIATTNNNAYVDTDVQLGATYSYFIQFGQSTSNSASA